MRCNIHQSRSVPVTRSSNLHRRLPEPLPRSRRPRRPHLSHVVGWAYVQEFRLGAGDYGAGLRCWQWTVATRSPSNFGFAKLANLRSAVGRCGFISGTSRRP